MERRLQTVSRDHGAPTSAGEQRPAEAGAPFDAAAVTRLCGQHDYVVVFVQRRGGELFAHFAASQSRDGFAFRIATRQDDEPLRIENRGDADGDGALGNAAAFEESRVRESRRMRQLDDARARREWRARLVESDMAVLAESEEGDAETAGFGDRLFVAIAFGIEIGCGAVGDVRVFHVDVDVIEEMVTHVYAVTAGMIAGDTGVLVEIERDDLAKAGVLARTFGDDVLVHADGRAAGGEADDDAGIVADRLEQCLRSVRGK